MKNIFLVCGSGASSGFMAASMRRAAKSKGMDVSIKAASEAQVENHLNEIDYLLVGPHLAYKVDDLTDQVKEHDITIEVIPQTIYGSLNGSAALDLLDI